MVGREVLCGLRVCTARPGHVYPKGLEKSPSSGSSRGNRPLRRARNTNGFALPLSGQPLTKSGGTSSTWTTARSCHLCSSATILAISEAAYWTNLFPAAAPATAPRSHSLHTALVAHSLNGGHLQQPLANAGKVSATSRTKANPAGGCESANEVESACAGCRSATRLRPRRHCFRKSLSSISSPKQYRYEE